ncbi:fimbria/pilus outer membrane usher protein [Yersinia entomophaga]|uniref:fimbria/pilus outer membrane usher protein n=1 Tax=Yersinia entomophaga TaxID=935293 RepID=UPI0009FED894|nr:fimbria/pilus outer membrane usher protein [Yersinia entomophaga]OWF87862.1 fimbrial assembly protein [Yersinia entomophaga]
MEKHCKPAGLTRHILWTLVSVASAAPIVNVSAADYFNPYALELKEGTPQNVSLGQFSTTGSQIPGTYRVDIYLNDSKVDERSVTFVDRNGKLLPELTTKELAAMGVNIEAFSSLKTLPPTQAFSNLDQHIPEAFTRFNFNRQRLDISIPQAALNNEARDAIDPKLWNQGIPAALVNYSFTGSNTWDSRSEGTNSNYYLNLRSGANLGAWRLRNYSTYTDNNKSGREWKNINTYVQRDIQPLKGALTLGDSSTPGEVFDSVQFRGVQLASDTNMLPDSRRGFAPVVRGIAQSNAQVIIRQNGYIIYQTYVPPGSFAITDLYPTSSSGGLDVTIREADGTERSFVQPFSAVPIMQREGQLKYAVTAGKYRTTTPFAATPNFAQSTLIYGLPADTTLYGGVLAAEKYTSGVLGVGHGFGDIGSISLDATQANTSHRGGKKTQGQSYRFQYSKDISTTNTNFTLAGYRYSTEGFYTLSETNEYRENVNGWRPNYNKRSKIQLNLNQSMGGYGHLYISGYQQDYWWQSGYERNISTGYNLNHRGINYSLSYSHTQTPGVGNSDSVLAFSVQVPLDRWLANSWSTYNVNHSKSGRTTQQLGLSGTALADNNLNYNIQQNYTNQGNGASGNLNANYRGTYGEIGSGYSYDNDSRRLNYNLRGGVVAHPFGVTFSQSQGETLALVKAPGASGVKVQNSSGVYTDWRGYAVVPYVSTYRKNRIALDTQTLGENIDIDTSVKTVVPTKGAVVLADFKTRVGKRALIKLNFDGKTIPFGANASLKHNDDLSINSGIVANNAEVYLSGIPDKGSLLVEWDSNGTPQKCVADYILPETSDDNGSSVLTLQASCKAVMT